MTISREQIAQTVTGYLASHPADTGRLAPLTGALADGVEVTSRSEMAGHVTAAVLLVSASGDVLHIHHKVLRKWLIPGGHLEAADASLPAAALRELAEETGITAVTGEPQLLDIDVHPIPASPRKGEGAHQHFDFRYLARARGGQQVVLQADEVTDHRWMPLSLADYPVVAGRLAAASRLS